MPQAGSMFEIDPAFVATSHTVGSLPLCEARLQGAAIRGATFERQM